MEKLYERVAIMEKKAEHLQYRIEMVERNHEAINELKTAVEILAHTNENQNKQFEMVSKSMEAVNENLINLNAEQREMRKEMTKQGSRLEKIEQVQEHSTISIPELTKKVLITALTGFGVFALGFLTIQYGLK